MTIDSDRLYILAFDQRGSFKRGLMGIDGEPTAEQRRRIRELKALVYEGFESAIDAGAPREACGVLVDEELGAEVARQARESGFRVAMPVERSGQEEFEFEYGEEFGEHIEAFDPNYAKVLVRYNPDGDHELNRRQASRLARLTDWLHERDRELLFELLVPATEMQMADAGGDQAVYDRDLRPGLVLRSIAALQQAGVEPDVWKIEGLDVHEDNERAAAQVRAGGRDGVACIVLGRGAEAERVALWLRQAATVRGYIGFAIGRTIWREALVEHLGGTLAREAAVERIARNYREMIDVYSAASAGREVSSSSTTGVSPRAK